MRRAALALIALAALAAAPRAAAAEIDNASVTPKQAFLGSPKPAQIRYRLSGDVAADVTIRVIGGGREVRLIRLPQVPPGDRMESWDGLTSAGQPAPDGTYRVLIAAGGAEREAGSVILRGHFFPVRGPHGTRGAVGEFGAGRNGGRIHKGFDVTGRCGTPLAAVRSGTVIRRAFDPRLDGNFIVIRGLGERRTYLYAHMARPSPFKRGEQVRTGDVLGHIGRTGNAGGTPCHLHLEIRLRGRWIDPEPELRAWDRHS